METYIKLGRFPHGVVVFWLLSCVPDLDALVSKSGKTKIRIFCGCKHVE